MSKICTRCKAQLPDNVMFCNRCGQRFVSNQGQMGNNKGFNPGGNVSQRYTPSTPQKTVAASSSILPVLIVILLIIVIAMLGPRLISIFDNGVFSGLDNGQNENVVNQQDVGNQTDNNLSYSDYNIQYEYYPVTGEEVLFCGYAGDSNYFPFMLHEVKSDISIIGDRDTYVNELNLNGTVDVKATIKSGTLPIVFTLDSSIPSNAEFYKSLYYMDDLDATNVVSVKVWLSQPSDLRDADKVLCWKGMKLGMSQADFESLFDEIEYNKSNEDDGYVYEFNINRVYYDVWVQNEMVCSINITYK